TRKLVRIHVLRHPTNFPLFLGTTRISRELRGKKVRLIAGFSTLQRTQTRIAAGRQPDETGHLGVLHYKVQIFVRVDFRAQRTRTYRIHAT
ncbi:unnamed protein product, partial [Mycena citricolor]